MIKLLKLYRKMHQSQQKQNLILRLSLRTKRSDTSSKKFKHFLKKTKIHKDRNPLSKQKKIMKKQFKSLNLMKNSSLSLNQATSCLQKQKAGITKLSLSLLRHIILKKVRSRKATKQTRLALKIIKKTFQILLWMVTKSKRTSKTMIWFLAS